ncbi:MAG: hypothetical protein B6U86_03370 [Candidatus Altiarchaeales archaeon ex4484_43]|nr:MAG: hypothetical protein B6U86_03370 [Candidatus Altiarchaeales archaeon ex4484_43]
MGYWRGVDNPWNILKFICFICNIHSIHKMRFYNRDEELRILQKLDKAKGFRFIVIYGRRRIGKTTLTLKFLDDKKYAYIFVPKGKTMIAFLEDKSIDLGIPRFMRFKDFLEYTLDTQDYVFFDEFQNFNFIDRSVFSDMQEIVDRYKRSNRDVFLIVSGSSYSLIHKIFGDYSHPLYGRSDLDMNLQPLRLEVIFNMLDDLGVHPLDEKIRYWSVFGGVPKYYEMLERVKSADFEETIVDLFFRRDSFFRDEGKKVLISEFGGEHKIYFSVLEAIASGRTSVSEISTLFDGKSTTASRYLDMMRKEYKLVFRETPLLSDPRKSRRGLYGIRDNFISFWFAFVNRYEAYFEQGRFDEVSKIFLDNHNGFTGRMFELIANEFLSKLNARRGLPATFTKIGRHWGSISGAEKGRTEYEIDLLALNEKTKEIGFFEVKWRDLNLREAGNLLLELRRKSEIVNWNSGERKEYYGLIAKKINGKEKLRKDGCLCYDLEDFDIYFK